MNKTPVIGIDLGTTNSCVGVYQYGKVEIIANDQGNRITPSCVAFTGTERFVGDPAKSQASRNPKNTIFSIKRLIGRQYDDPDLQNDIKNFPFEVTNIENRPNVKVVYKDEEKMFCPEEISSMILMKMKQTAEDYLNCEVKDAVITVPAYFNDLQRKATMDAAAIAQLNVLRIINEPTAAAIAFGLHKSTSENRNILVYDLGGGTFDVSILVINDDTVKVKAVAGNTHLGGDDFNNNFVNYCIQEFKRKHKIDLTTNKRAIMRLRKECEQIKHTLSFFPVADLEIESLSNGIDFTAVITRALFEELNGNLFRTTIDEVAKALKDAELDKSSIHEVIVVGGSTRIPKIQNLLQEFFEGKTLNKSVNADEAVAYGAAIQAALLSDNETQNLAYRSIEDVTPLSLGTSISTGEMSVIIKRNSIIPIKATKTYYTIEDDQIKMLIDIFQGERNVAKENQFLGEFTLTGLPPLPAWKCKVDVTFNIDFDGILTVTAVETSKNISKEITISNDQWRLPKSEIQRMMNNAILYREEDEKRFK